MQARPPELQAFLTAAHAAFGARIGALSPAAVALPAMARAMAEPARAGALPAPRRLPACQHLAPAIATAMRGPADLAGLAKALGALAPALHWRSRDSEDRDFARGHANATVLGPQDEALERRDDVRIGVSVMAPGVTYPDHAHPPEEVYLALSAGAWRQLDNPWHEPGPGGIVHNPPGILHAMRSGAGPFLAIWCLPLR